MTPTVAISRRGVQYVLLDVQFQPTAGGGGGYVGICVNVATHELGVLKLEDLKIEDPLALVRKEKTYA